MRQSDKVNFFLTPVRENPAREWQQYALYSRHNAFGYDGATYNGGPLQFFSLDILRSFCCDIALTKVDIIPCCEAAYTDI